MQDPQANALLDEAVALMRKGQATDAAAILAPFANADPASTPLLNALAQAHFAARHFAASERCLLRSLEAETHQPGALVQLGRVRAKLGRPGDAIDCFDGAISMKPADAAAHFHRGQALRRLGRLDESLASYDKAVALAPDQASFHILRSVLLSERGEPDEALASCERARALQPQAAGVSFVKAELLLMAGDYLAAWGLFEARWNGPWRTADPALANIPVWTGAEPIAGRRILVHPELGLGDFLMYARYLPLLQEAGATPLVVAPAPLVPLLRGPANLPFVAAVGEPCPAPDFRCPIMSLPRAFGTTLDTVPVNLPYLDTTAASREAWRSRLGRRTGAPRVGLVWQGKARREIDGVVHKNRSMPLAELGVLWSLPVEFHCLQKDLSEADSASVKGLPLRVHSAELTDFLQTAALAQEMDLVISIDTSVAHLAGALGKPLWVMLPYSSDFRWPKDSRGTPWYPSATTFRQVHPGRWGEVAQSVARELSAFVQARERA